MSRSLNGILSIGCIVLAVVLPVAGVLYFWVMPEAEVAQSLRIPQAHLGIRERAALVLLSTVPPACTAYGLMRARQCFVSFGRGAFFSLEVVRGLRGFAAGVAWSAVTALLATPILSFLLTLDAADQRISVNLGSQQLLGLLFGGILWQIATVMTKASALAEENAQFV